MVPDQIAESRLRRFFLSALVPLVAGTFLLLGAGGAQAATVILDPSDSTKAIGIRNLEIGGGDITGSSLFNVDFTTQQSAASTYGFFPGDLFLFLPLDGKAEAIADTMDLINFQLNQGLGAEAGILGVGSDAPLSGSFNNYFIGYQTENGVGPFAGVEVITAWDSGQISADWTKNTTSTFAYNADTSTAWAVITPVPEPGTALLMGLGLAGLGAAGRSRRGASRKAA